jgi:hypothetical protein
MAYISLLDWSRRVGPDGNIDEIAELLSQCNEIFKDMPWRQSNLPTGHKSTVRTGLPTATWRLAYQGVAYTKSETAQVTDTWASLDAYSQIDEAVAELNGNVAELRTDEDNATLEGMSQQMATTFFYGNVATNPSQFSGLSVRYNTVSTSNAKNAVNVLNAGGTQSANASLWLVGWGDMTCFSFFPKGGKAGLVFEDRGNIVPGYDSSQNPFPAYTSYFNWKAGLCLKDWRYVSRLANIDTTTATLGLQGTNPPDLFQFMSKMVVRLPTMSRRVSGITETDAPDEPSPGIIPVWYCNRTVREYLDIQAVRDRNVLLKPTEYAGEPVIEFRQVPIRVCDALTNSEATLT